MRIFFKRFFPYMRGYKLFFCFAIFGSLLVALSSSAGAYLVKPVLDDIFINKDLDKLTVLPLLVVLAYFLKGLGGYIQTYFMNFIGQDILRTVREELFNKILSFEINFFNRLRNGELVARITNDIGAISNAVSNYFIEGIRDILTILALIVVVIYQSAELALYGLLVLPLALFPLSKLAKKMRYLSRKTQEKNADMTAKLVESCANIELIKATSGEKIESEHFSKESKKLFSFTIRGVRVSELTNPLMETLGAIAIALVIFVGGKEVISGDLTPGEFFSFTAALFMIYTPFKRVSTLYNKFQVAFSAGERIFELLNRTPQISDGSKELKGDIQSITLENVGLKYGEKEALCDINLRINKGDTVAFIGDSGGGKSSLVNLILRLYEPTSGRICFNGEDIKDFTQKSLRDKIAIVTQRVFIFNESVAYNVAYGLKIDRDKIQKALQKARAWEFVEQLSDGMDTILDENGTNLSGGQRQRIAIARAIYKDPEILILDEATSALDNKTEMEFKEALKEVLKDRITIIIAHRLSTVLLAKEVYLFRSGRIVATTEADLLQTHKDFKEFYKMIG